MKTLFFVILIANLVSLSSSAQDNVVSESSAPATTSLPSDPRALTPERKKELEKQLEEAEALDSQIREDEKEGFPETPIQITEEELEPGTDAEAGELGADEEIESEISESQNSEIQLPQEPEALPEVAPLQKSSNGLVEQELKAQEELLRIKQTQQVDYSPTQDRYPESRPLFQKPEGPAAGGKVRMPHPSAKEGLVRINEDGSYQYKVPIRTKTQSMALRYSQLTQAPAVANSNGTVSYEKIYGAGSVSGFDFNYEYQAFQKFGRFGLLVGGGFFQAKGNAVFETARDNGATVSQDEYSLYMLPVSAFLNYRFEYTRRQWVVPYAYGGGTLWSVFEDRQDAGVYYGFGPSIGGGGGLLFSITAIDSNSAVRLDREYGIADLWLQIEGRYMKGLSSKVDFTTPSIHAGIVADF